MRLFILIIYLTCWGGIDLPPIQKIVSSPEEAAVVLWQHNHDKYEKKYHRDRGELYKVSLDTFGIEQVPIPGICFLQQIGERELESDEDIIYDPDTSVEFIENPSSGTDIMKLYDEIFGITIGDFGDNDQTYLTSDGLD